MVLAPKIVQPRSLVPFFERQQTARARERAFLVKFVLATLGCLAIVAALLTWMIQPFLESTANVYTMALSWAIAVTLTFASVAIWLRRRRLRAAAEAIAYAGDLRDIDSSADPRWRRAGNVMHEMCIAAGMPMPELGVMIGQSRINSVALGHGPADATILVTRGAIETLNRTELQALLAHSLGQIANGDMALHMRLSSYLYVLKAMPMLARSMIVPDDWTGMRIKDQLAWLLVFLWLGLALGALVAPGYFAANILHFLIERERQSYADACALQFTRYPESLKTLLMKASALDDYAARLPAEFELLSYCFFISPRPLALRQTLHPVVLRLRTLGLPNLTIAALVQKHREFREAWEQEARVELERAKVEASQAASGASGKVLIGQAVMAAVLATSVGASQAGAARAPPRQPIASADDPRAQLLALLIDRRAEVERAQIEALSRCFSEVEASHVNGCLESARRLSSAQRSLRVDALLPSLRRLENHELERMLAALRDLEHSDPHFDVFDFALARGIATFAQDLRNPGPLHGSLGVEDVAAELHVLLSAVSGYGPRELAVGAYEAGRRFIGATHAVPLRRTTLKDLGTALQILDQLQPLGKELVLEAVTVVIDFDRSRSLAERELLRAIGAAIHCALPRSTSPSPA